jgi:hypothetical protein
MLINTRKEIYLYGIIYKLCIDLQDSTLEEDYCIKLKEDIKVRQIDGRLKN